MIVFNKTDRIERIEADSIGARYDAVALSALDPETFGPLLERIEYRLWESQRERSEELAVSG